MNDYLVFSAILVVSDQHELDWLQDQLMPVPYYKKLERVPVVPWEETVYDRLLSPILAEAASDKEKYDDLACLTGLGFEWTTQNDGIWIHSNANGNADHVALLVYKFLRHFQKKDVWSMTWAAYSDGEEIGAQSGGAIVVTKDSIDLLHATIWAQDFVAAKEKA